jgi:hypothetical protein
MLPATINAEPSRDRYPGTPCLISAKSFGRSQYASNGSIPEGLVTGASVSDIAVVSSTIAVLAPGTVLGNIATLKVSLVYTSG